MKRLLIGLLVLGSVSAFASPAKLSGECRNVIYGSSLNTLLKSVLPVADGSQITLEHVEGLEGTQRTYIASLVITGGFSGQVKVVLKKAANLSCEVKSSTLIVD